MKGIRVYYKNFYLFTTTQYKTIKELKLTMSERKGKKIFIQTANKSETHILDDLSFYNFEIVTKPKTK